MMHWLYSKADRIVAVTDGISEYIKMIGIDRECVTTIKSGVSDDFINADSNGIRTRYGWENKFLVMYSGTLGWVRPLETMIEAARKLADQPDIHFVFLGDGQKKLALRNMVRDYGLKNVTFLEAQPLDTIPYFLKAGDILVESLKEVTVASMAFPSKMYEYMASGRPIVFGARDGEAIRELRKAGGALTYPPDEPESLCDLILKVRSGEIDGVGLGERYRNHISQYHHREIWAKRYMSFIESV
jgi:glycosyltransferase involved in cell wall biosynthesis